MSNCLWNKINGTNWYCETWNCCFLLQFWLWITFLDSLLLYVHLGCVWCKFLSLIHTERKMLFLHPCFYVFFLCCIFLWRDSPFLHIFSRIPLTERTINMYSKSMIIMVAPCSTSLYINSGSVWSLHLNFHCRATGRRNSLPEKENDKICIQ